MNNPYQMPSSSLSQPASPASKYVGFWARTGAALIDSVIMLVITYPLLVAIYGKEYFSNEHFIAGIGDFLLSYVFPAVAVLLFWIYKSATPGKMAIKAIIVDANTGQTPSKGQLIGRYFAYYLSILPLGLGILWVAWDARKQGWHDKLAGTLVVHAESE